MKKFVFVLFFIALISTLNHSETTNVVVHLENQQQEKMKLLFGLIDFPESLDELVSTLCADLSCSQQKKAALPARLKNLIKFLLKRA